MISAASRLLIGRSATATPRLVIALQGSSRSMMAVNTTFGAKEKVEEDRYIRAREQELARARAQAAQAEMKQKELEQKSAELVITKGKMMKDIADLLALTGDVVSEAGLANLADWKVGK